MNLVNKEYHKRARTLIDHWQDRGVFSGSFEVPPVHEAAVMIDHTLVKPDASISAVNRICKEAREYGFASVCVNPVHVEWCASILDSAVPLGTVVGFPLGANHTRIKAAETELAVKQGATEINMVINVGLLKTANYQDVFEDIKAVRLACPEAELKVTLETSLLESKEIVVGCLLCREAGADYVQTSTGFSAEGATPEQVSLMRFVVGEDLGVVAAGEMSGTPELSAMLKAGATRLSIFNLNPADLLASLEATA